MLTAKQFTKKVFELVKADHFLPVTEHQVYSTAETKVGVWTDGKPLYRKVVTLQFASSITDGTLSDKDYTAQALGLQNTTVISVDAKVVNGANLPWVLATYYGIIQCMPDGSIKTRGNHSSLAGQNINVSILYTKTTDTASTPKVPYEPLIEYSTNEKLIGYDENGDALYRMTIKTGEFSFSSNTAVTKTYSVSGKYIRKIEGGFTAKPNNTNFDRRSTFIPFGYEDINDTAHAGHFASVVWQDTLYFVFKRGEAGVAEGIAVIEYTKTT